MDRLKMMDVLYGFNIVSYQDCLALVKGKSRTLHVMGVMGGTATIEGFTVPRFENIYDVVVQRLRDVNEKSIVDLLEMIEAQVITQLRFNDDMAVFMLYGIKYIFPITKQLSGRLMIGVVESRKYKSNPIHVLERMVAEKRIECVVINDTKVSLIDNQMKGGKQEFISVQKAADNFHVAVSDNILDILDELGIPTKPYDFHSILPLSYTLAGHRFDTETPVLPGDVRSWMFKQLKKSLVLTDDDWGLKMVELFESGVFENPVYSDGRFEFTMDEVTYHVIQIMHSRDNNFQYIANIVKHRGDDQCFHRLLVEALAADKISKPQYFKDGTSHMITVAYIIGGETRSWSDHAVIRENLNKLVPFQPVPLIQEAAACSSQNVTPILKTRTFTLSPPPVYPKIYLQVDENPGIYRISNFNPTIHQAIGNQLHSLEPVTTTEVFALQMSSERISWLAEIFRFRSLLDPARHYIFVIDKLGGELEEIYHSLIKSLDI